MDMMRAWRSAGYHLFRHDGGREEPRLGDAEQETRHIELGGVVTSMVPADTRPHRIMMAAMQRRMPSLYINRLLGTWHNM